MRVNIVGQERQHCVDQDKYDMRECDKGVYLSLPLNFFVFYVSKSRNCRFSEFLGEANNKRHRETGKAVREGGKVGKILKQLLEYA